MAKTQVLVALVAAALFMGAATGTLLAADPPSSFDLRNVGGHNYVTSVKSQKEGTCWTHGIMAAIEGNLLMTDVWEAAGEESEPNLAEYHLDWWNGFNKHNNDDIDPPNGSGLRVHYGGDYRVGSAYTTRGEGAVRDCDGQSFGSPPQRYNPVFHYYYARDIEWYMAGSGLGNIDLIKNKIMTEGVMGTCLCYSSSFMSNNVHYQPSGSSLDPNHAVAIIGWDDNKNTQASQNGAWLIKNSWGASWGDDGYFWISYYDKHCGQHPEMGAVSFQNVEPLPFDTKIYYHDYHGWRDQIEDVTEAFNAFTIEGAASGVEELKAVSFFTAADDVNYTVRIYDSFQGGALQNELAVKSGTIAYTGFHTIDLDTPLTLYGGDDFYVYVQLSAGGHPYDRTSEVPVLLGSKYRTLVESSASPGESYYFEGGIWKDLTDYDSTANFCIKALSRDLPAVILTFPDGIPEQYESPGAEVVISVEVQDGVENFVPGTGSVFYRYNSSGAFLEAPFVHQGGDLYAATVPGSMIGGDPEYYFSAMGDGGTTSTVPPGAPEYYYSYNLVLEYLVLHDDFETDLGWSVVNENLSQGAWERADPNGTFNGSDPAAPDNDNPDGTGTICYVTLNGAPGGGASASDVDGGPTRLISPTFAIYKRDAYISFYYWFYNDDGDDTMRVGISNDGGNEWNNVAVLGAGQWSYYRFRVGEYIWPTDQTLIRFNVSDNPNNSITEAGIDDFRIEYINYNPSLYAAAYAFSGSEGCDIDLFLDEPYRSRRKYLLVGGISGVYPGTPLPQTGITIPINQDWFTSYVQDHINGNIFRNFRGTLNWTGQAVATLHIAGPGASSYIGQTLSFAFTTAGDYDYASNPVSIEIEP